MSIILLSASIPTRTPWTKWLEPLLIREAVIGLNSIVAREGELVFGGHPAISPLVEHASRDLRCIDRVHIFQSEFFRHLVPEEARKFPNLHWTQGMETRERSLSEMRERMASFRAYDAMVIVGGMDGIEEEISIFKRMHPRAPVYPIASTGGAAYVKWSSWRDEMEKVNELLSGEFNYKKLFRKLLNNTD